jgi:hypothetical protein
MSVFVKEGEKLASTLEHEDEDEGKNEHAGLDARVHFFIPKIPLIGVENIMRILAEIAGGSQVLV